MAATDIPLNRSFSPISRDVTASEESEYALFLGLSKPKYWADLEKEYRVVILADAGAGKTFETRARAVYAAEQGRTAFFIRIEDIDANFEEAFEVGNAQQFEQWLASSAEAWFFLDSVDEARLDNPRSFEKAIKRFAGRIHPACHRAHIYITSRPYAWRYKTDCDLIDQFLPFAPLERQTVGDEQAILEDTDRDKPETALQLYALRPLDLDDIRRFAECRDTPNIDRLIVDIERANLMEMAARPFDLEGVLVKWREDGRLGGRLELLRHNIQSRLDEIDPGRMQRQPLNREKAHEGARLLAAAVTLTGKAGILVPDATPERTGIDARDVLADWEHNDVRALLERGLFNDVIYGAVRFRHRDVRELLTAEWLYSLLQRGNSRRKIESLIFREQYGEWVIAPRLRPILPWLILFDDQIRQRALALHPEIAVEGGDVARLPIAERRSILSNIVASIVDDVDDRTGRDNDAISRIAQPDLSQDARRLIESNADNDDAMFFLGRLVWQGNMADCLDLLFPIAANPTRSIYARIASVRAIMTVGSEEQKIALWQSIIELPDEFPRRLLAELAGSAATDQLTADLILKSVKKLPPYARFEATGLGRVLHTFIDRLPIKDGYGNSPLAHLIVGFNKFLDREPHHERRECRVSKDFTWLLGPATHAVERLVSARADESFEEAPLTVLLKVPAVRFWHVDDFDEYKSKLDDLVPAWPELNDALFWKSIDEARLAREGKSERLTDYWTVQWLGHFWKFDADSFRRVLAFISIRPLEDDKLVALSLAARLFTEAARPVLWEEQLRDAVAGDATLEESLEQLLNPVVSEEHREWERRQAERKHQYEARRLAQERGKAQWIERLRAHPDAVNNPPEWNPGDLTNDQYWLLRELLDNSSGTSRCKGMDWQMLISEFGEEVALAFRNAAMARWRDFKPDLPSEGADTRTVPYSLVFAMIGLEIEAHEEAEFPRHLSQAEAAHALRYITWEINGFPDWLESMHKTYPELVTALIWQELKYELDNSQPDQPMHGILHDINYHAPWLHSEIATPILQWVQTNPMRNQDCLRYCLCILVNGGASPEALAELAQAKISSGGLEDRLSVWYALWAGVFPETGIPSLEAWLDGLDAESGALAAHHFILALLGDRYSWLGVAFTQFRTAPYLKTLYVLMHKHIRAADDVDRTGTGVYRPTSRDDAQRARDQLFKMLSEIPGKATYIALMELANHLPDEGHRAWMAKHARQRAENDADLEFWSPRQVSEFTSSLESVPATHRQLFEIGVSHLIDFREWLERGNDSLAETLQKVADETEMRKNVAHWLNQHANGRYTCAQENPLANNQRPDIWLQHPDIASPVPIELKLLDMKWSGPDLCERLRNQLAGDYLREEAAGCGIFLLIWQGRNPGRNWSIEGESVDATRLRDALIKYWGSISDTFPNVSDIEIIVIDLTLRAKQSGH